MPSRLIKRLTGVFLLLGGLAFIGTGATFAVVNFRFLESAERAPGTVVAIIAKRGARGMTLYRPKVEFRPSGQTDRVTFVARPGMWPSPFAVGDDVTVAYAPRDPDDARLVSFWTLWFLPIAVALLGGGCLVAGRDTLKKAV